VVQMEDEVNAGNVNAPYTLHGRNV
jgi:hypothetical protein